MWKDTAWGAVWTDLCGIGLGLDINKCPSLTSIAVIKYYDRNQQGDKKACFAYMSLSQSVTEWSQGRNLSRNHAGSLFTVCVLFTFHNILSFLSYITQNHQTWIDSPTTSSETSQHPHQSLIKKVISDMFTSPSDGGNPSSEFPSS